MGLLARLFGRGVRAQIENCTHIVGMAVAIYLHKKYAGKFGDAKAAALASAVTNELFGAPPGNEAGCIFLDSNRQLIEAALQDIKNEPQVCQIVSLIAHLRGNVAGNTGAFSSELVMLAVRLHKLEILVPIDQVEMPSSQEALMRQAREFELWALKNSS